MAKPKAKKTKKKEKKHVVHGQAHIKSTFNNTIVTITDLQGKIIDRCLQLFGGYGYMEEFPISRMYRDARVMRIYAGTNEIMKLLIARSL